MVDVRFPGENFPLKRVLAKENMHLSKVGNALCMCHICREVVRRAQ
jgi:hypothetical protein